MIAAILILTTGCATTGASWDQRMFECQTQKSQGKVSIYSGLGAVGAGAPILFVENGAPYGAAIMAIGAAAAAWGYYRVTDADATEQSLIAERREEQLKMIRMVKASDENVCVDANGTLILCPVSDQSK